jgi:hypothetical protein
LHNRDGDCIDCEIKELAPQDGDSSSGDCN